MKLDKIEKIIISVLAVLIVTAILSNLYEHKKYLSNRIMPTYINITEEEEIPQDIRELSQKYQTYIDLYKSDKPTLVYSYTTYKNSVGRDKNFHKKLSEKLKKENLNIETVVFKNWEDDSLEIGLKNSQYLNNTESCGPSGPSEEQLKKFVDLSQRCINNVCLVDVKNHKYTLISPDADYVIKTIKNYKL